MHSERRSLVRHPTAELLKILEGDGTQRSATLTDLSTSGLGFTSTHTLPIGVTLLVSFDLNIRDARKRVNALGKLVYIQAVGSERYRAGMRFIDMDSRSRLLIESVGQRPSDT